MEAATGDGATVLCGKVTGVGCVRKTGSFSFWGRAVPPESRSTTTTAANRIESSIRLNQYTKKQVRGHSVIFILARLQSYNVLARNLDKWHDLCKSLEEADKFLSQIAFAARDMTCGPPPARLFMCHSPVFALKTLTCSRR